MISLEDEESLAGNRWTRQRVSLDRKFQLLNIFIVAVMGIIVISVVSAMYASTKEVSIEL
jgi:hypothetical protein